MRAARSASASMAMARSDGSASIHSMRDRAGAGADVPQQFAAARRQRRQRQRADLALGDLAVMLEQVVGQARRQRQDARASAPPRPRSPDVERIDVVEMRSVGAGRCACVSRGPPSASSTVESRRAEAARQAARRPPPGRSRPRSARARGVPGCSSGRIRSIGGRAARRSRCPASGQPSRAAARLKADGAGSTSISAAAPCRASVAPTPWKNGSPEASTQTGVPRKRQHVAHRGVEGRRPWRGFALDESRGQRQMTLAAEDDSASAMRRLASSPRPATPSSPMPTMVSQGWLGAARILISHGSRRTQRP